MRKIVNGKISNDLSDSSVSRLSSETWLQLSLVVVVVVVLMR